MNGHHESLEQSIPPRDENAALRAIVEGTVQSTGQAFFQSLVKSLAQAIDARHVFAAEFAGPDRGRVRTLAYCRNGTIADNLEWDLPGTPCEDVVAGKLCHHPANVWRDFPEDKPLVEQRIESYLGVPLKDTNGEVLGHLAVYDDRPMPEEQRRLAIFRIFAARAAAELDRLRFERRLIESEERFRDLFEQAPIAYVHEGLDSRFIQANRAAMQILGIRPDQIEGTYGKSFVPDTPDAQRRLQEAFASIGRGTDTSGVVLELRRKDDGRPIWIQWWSKPDPGGGYTRTMFVDITDRVLMEREKARVEQQNVYLQEEIKQAHNFDEIIGKSAALVAVLENVRRVSATDASVLITGETGTGKELIARAIHSASARKDKPLIKVNCAALPTGLVESELFGHERGAFSGAIARRIGKFELAHGGTIFLDEIGELPLDVQVKLLRVLQEREFDRVGGSSPIKVDVRIIAATNRDLLKSSREGRFREDLYYRLNVFPVALPPLRDRREDISMLVQFLLGKFRTRLGKRIDGVTAATMRRLTEYPWPGNVRELENVLERAAILAGDPILDIDVELLPGVASGSTCATDIAAAGGSDPPISLSAAEREHILSALRRTNWVIDGPSGAARVLDMHPNTLRSRLKKLGIARPATAASHEPS
ncbi:MAG: sigma 54-interacting transcriptional regulator [Tepidisphaeraceae bacterium]